MEREHQLYIEYVHEKKRGLGQVPDEKYGGRRTQTYSKDFPRYWLYRDARRWGWSKEKKCRIQRSGTTKIYKDMETGNKGKVYRSQKKNQDDTKKNKISCTRRLSR